MLQIAFIQEDGIVAFSALSRVFRRYAVLSLSMALVACDQKPGSKPAGPPTSVIAVWEDSLHLCFKGCPVGAPAANRIIQRPIYVLSNNGTTKFADWAAYVVTSSTIGTGRKRIWHTDPDLPAGETLTPADYRGIGGINMDRGHQVPLASVGGSPDWEAVDNLSNITPQMHALNGGAWEALESAERMLVRQGVSVHVETGLLYERAMPKLPNAHLPHTVPSGYWKMVAVEEDGVIETAAFIMEQNLARRTDFCTTTVTIRSVETRAHLDLLPNVPQPLQDKIEKTSGALLPKLGC